MKELIYRFQGTIIVSHIVRNQVENEQMNIRPHSQAIIEDSARIR